MSVRLDETSCVQWFEETEGHRCGYCGQENTSLSNGMWAHSLTVEDYQNLIDRGWRRSGMYCYKPMMKETCCPQYTIKEIDILQLTNYGYSRCDIINFSLSKSQKKVIKKLNKYLETDILSNKDKSSEGEEEEQHGIGQETLIRDKPNIDIKNIDLNSIEMDNKKDGVNVDPQPSVRVKASPCPQETVELEKSVSPSGSSKQNVKKGDGADCSKPPRKKAKLLRLERKTEKLLKQGLVVQEKNVSNQKSLEQFLEEMPTNAKNRLKIKLEIMSKTSQTFEVSADLFRKYQMFVHGDSPEDCDKRQFVNFLVDTPLKPEKFPGNVAGPGYGSFHQQYWLDGKLIAVGVLDILPRCVSSVYFFYDPDYRSLTLGTYGSLREVQLTKSLNETLPNLTSYYMGFYIHSCPKMRYKGKMTPSFLACPETYKWIPIEKCVPILDNSKYARLNGDEEAKDDDLPSPANISDIKIVYRRRLMRFRDGRFPSNFHTIGKLIGKDCCGKLVFFEE